jgi:ATP-dependent exoDNAse (exonuclease V) alpha subunit
MRHFDHGHAVTSHSAQGLTAERVLINVDTSVHPELINARFAYVAVSRGSDDARLFTNDASSMSWMHSQDSGKSSALEMR